LFTAFNPTLTGRASIAGWLCRRSMLNASAQNGHPVQHCPAAENPDETPDLFFSIEIFK